MHECSFKLYTKCTINNKVYSAVQFGFSNQFSWEGDNNMYLFTMKYLFLNTNMHANSIYLAFEQYPSLIINFRYLFLWQKQINKNISWLVYAVQCTTWSAFKISTFILCAKSIRTVQSYRIINTFCQYVQYYL